MQNRLRLRQRQAADVHRCLVQRIPRLIAHVRDAKQPLSSIDHAIERAPFLTDKNLPLRHWSRTAMFGPEGRARWVEPDLAPLPF